MDFLSALLVAAIALLTSLLLLPPLIRKMREGGMVGPDVNKPERPGVASLGGIAALFAFSTSLSLVLGLKKLFEAGPGPAEPPYLAAIAVFFVAAMIGLIDDVSRLKQRVKALAALFAALPLLLVHFRDGVLAAGIVVVGHLPFGVTVDLSSLSLVYWLVLVPLGVTGVANAMNMSAGYNGLESGQIALVSGSLLLVTAVLGLGDVPALVFAGILGASLGLYAFNRHPARVFVGDIGTLGLGAAIAAGAILGGLEVYGVIAIAPAFYEAAATFYYSFIRPAPDRRQACMNPVFLEGGRIAPPKGAERYTLAYLLLSRKPMTERQLVGTLLALYAASGAAAVLLGLLASVG